MGSFPLFGHIPVVGIVVIEVDASEVGLSAGPASEVVSVAGLHDVVESGGDALVAGIVEGVESHVYDAVAAAVDLVFVCDLDQLVDAVDLHDLDDAGLGLGGGVDEEGVGVGFIVCPLEVSVTERVFPGAGGLAAELGGDACLQGRVDGLLDLADQLGVVLGDDDADAVLFLGAVGDDFGGEEVDVAQAALADVELGAGVRVFVHDVLTFKWFMIHVWLLQSPLSGASPLRFEG